jgi:hypothetical protein
MIFFTFVCGFKIVTDKLLGIFLLFLMILILFSLPFFSIFIVIRVSFFRPFFSFFF